METVSIIAAAIALYLGLIIFRGNQVIRRREEFIRLIKKSENIEIEYLGFLSYHGGFPEIPIPQKLNVAVARDYILLFTNKAHYGKVPFRACQKIDSFTTKKKQDSSRQSIVMWGPLNNILFKETFRHFIVINYNSEDQENNIVLEHDSKEKMQEIFEKLLSQQTGEYPDKVMQCC